MITIKTVKKWTGVLMAVLFCFSAGGCYNYLGLDDIAIVMGAAVDKNAESGQYHLSLECVDLSEATSKQGTMKSKIFETEGDTVFDAVRNSRKKLGKHLYFSDMQIVVISEWIARNEGIEPVIDFFLRDAESRETVDVVISQEPTAKDLISAQGVTMSFSSQEIKTIIDQDNKSASYTKNIPLYKAYDSLQGEGSSLVLPVFHLVTGGDSKEAEENGLAVFKEDKLIGYLTPEEAKTYLFIEGEVKGGIFTVNTSGTDQTNVSLEIKGNKTKTSYTCDGNQVKVSLNVKTSVYLGELENDGGLNEKEETKKAETAASEKQKQQIEALIQKVQTEYHSDIFGFGAIIYNKQPALWKQLKENGDQYFDTMTFEVQTKVSIKNTALSK